MVQEYGPERWQAVLARAGLSGAVFTPNRFVSDPEVSALFEAGVVELALTPEALADRFGRWWACDYAPRLYGRYYERFDGVRSFLEGLNEVHQDVTRWVRDARPPFIETQWRTDRELRILYRSPRALVTLFAGVVRGLGLHFGEPLHVEVLGPEEVVVRWLDPGATA